MSVTLQKETNLYDTEAIADGIAGAISAYDASQDQTAIFNKLTDNGVIRGIFMQDGQLYINMDYLQTGELKLGGVNNGNGVMVVYDASGNEIGRWDRDGIVITNMLKLTDENDNYKLTYTMGSSKGVLGFSDDGVTPIISDTLGEISSYEDKSNNNAVIGYLARAVAYSKLKNTVSNTTVIKGKKIESTMITDGNVSITTAPTSYGAMATVEDVDSNGIPRSIKKFFKVNGSTYTNAYYTSISPKGLHFNSGYGERQKNISYSDTSPEITVTDAFMRIRACGHELYMAESFHLSGISSIYGYIELNDRTLSIRGGKASGGGHPSIYMDSVSKSCSITPVEGRYIYYSDSSGYWNIYGANRSGNIAVQSASSKRYKHDISEEISEKLDAHKLYELKMKQFAYNDDCKNWQYADMKGKILPGFIAEDVEEVYPAAVIHDPDGRVETWDERRIMPGMLKLIQEQHEEIEDLKQQIAKLL